MTDATSPGVSADTARNLDAWYSAFDVQPGQKLYLAPRREFGCGDPRGGAFSPQESSKDRGQVLHAG